ncbi:MAG TPA: hypothetical protein VLS45_06290 [Methylomicrobium sp.]|nr:hypothetical protein [Methylomicrobium sp.]
MAKIAPTIFFFTALPCEASPLIERFKLKKDLTSQAFDVYLREEICLTITGIGKCAMAAGVAYTLARMSAAENPILLNIGIAGHAVHDLGSVFLAGKIIDAETLRNYYPPLLFSPPCPVETVRTQSRPQLDYTETHLHDMEASAFYETAVRFSTGEVVHCLKIVSDNRLAPAENVQPKLATALIAGQLRVVDALLAELRPLQGLLDSPEPRQLRQLLDLFHFTAHERRQLRNQMLRWECLTDGQRLEIDPAAFRNAKDVLLWLTRQIDSVEYTL